MSKVYSCFWEYSIKDKSLHFLTMSTMRWCCKAFFSRSCFRVLAICR